MGDSISIYIRQVRTEKKEKCRNWWVRVGGKLVKGGILVSAFPTLRLSGSFGSEALRLLCSVLRPTLTIFSVDVT